MKLSKNRNRIKAVPRLATKLGVRQFAIISSALMAAIVFGWFGFLNFQNETAHGSTTFASLSFHNPVLIQGTGGQVGAIYLFSNVTTGIDAQIEILDLHNGARLDDMDHFTAGYLEAWQPFVAAPGGTENASWIDWGITFKEAGTNQNTKVKDLSATAIDVDGDGGYLRELVEGDQVLSYSMLPTSVLTITFNSDSCRATSTFANVANIDTNRVDAMFMMSFKNVSSIEYRTGAISNYGAEQVRQNCIYFRYFNVMPAPTPLPIELISFNAKADQTKIALQWSTASEVNNDYFTIERCTDGKDFEKILTMKGAGNSNSVINYSAADNYPLSGTSYYRLKQTDFDGKFSYSTVRTVTNNNNQKSDLEIKSVAPSLFYDNFNINFISKERGEINFVLTNISGQVMVRQIINAQEGNNSYQFTDEQNIPKGIYFVTLLYNDKKASYKVVKQ